MRTIRVTGKGNVSVKPDTVRLILTSKGSFKEYETSIKKAAEATEEIKELFEKLGFDRKDLRTEYFDIDAKYNSYTDKTDGKWKSIFEGYEYTQRGKIEFALDNKLLGKVLYALSRAETKVEFSIEFTVADPEKSKNQLLHCAIEDSMQKAKELTYASNVKLGLIQSIDYSWSQIDIVSRPMRYLDSCCERLESPSTSIDMDIDPDDINLSDTVTVVWEIY